ncbi:tetratricopeptide repeat protein [Thermospira aquatica]|uniref:Tetratricopeptide repeat protein n=1 Tax=Thermospira aquatica TaxID=2828656 RepID=A0AAX3BEY6_9SPIR|nr:tetratricopeptide repeat protein [Thermospira aquatica]URA10830.1 tetratricopeptide repeat protein [Thermospira aquatica]
MKKQSILLLFLWTSLYAQNIPLLTPEQAEAQYAYGLSLAYQDEKESALLVLGQLAENGYHNPYAFQMILSIGSSLLQQRQSSILSQEKLFSLINYLADLAYTNYFTNREVLYGYLDVKKSLGEWADFDRALKQLLVIDPENMLGNFYRGLLLYNQQRFEEAKGYLWRVISNTNDEPSSQQAVYQSYYLLGLIELRYDNYRAGIELLEKAKKIFDQDYNLDKYLAFGYQQILEARKAYTLVTNIPELLYSGDVALIRIQTGFFLREKGWERLASAYEKEVPLAKAYQLYAQKKYKDVISTIDRLSREYQVEPVRIFYANYLKLKAAEALKDNKTKREMLFLMGYYAQQVGQTSLAIEFLLPLEKEPDLRLDALITLGSLYEEVGNYGEAIKRYELFLKEKTADIPREKVFDITLALAFLHMQQTNSYRSDIYSRQAEALAQSPLEKYRFWYYTGLIAQQKNLHEQALQSFQKAKSFSNTAAVNYSLGNSFFLLQRLLEAQRALEESIHLGPTAETYNLLAYIYALRKVSLDKALEYIQKALAIQPANIAYQDTLGWIYFQMGEYEKALEVFASILLTLDGMEPFEGIDEIYYHIGMVYEALKCFDDAKLMWEKGLSINPKNGYIKDRLLTR